MDANERYIDEALLKKDEKPTDEAPNLDALKIIGKVKQKGEGAVKTFFRFLWDVKILIIVQFLALLLIGLDKFVKADWSWEVFKDAEFWNSYLLYSIANWCVIIGWIIRRFSVLKEKHSKYVANQNHIQAKIDIDYDAPFIEEQANIEDTVRRVEIYNNDIYRKLYALSVKHKIRDLNAFYKDPTTYTAEALKSFKGARKWLKRLELNRVHEKVSDLREKLKKDWQKRNLPSQKIKYPRVTRNLITSGLKPQGEFYRYNNYEAKTFSTTLKTIAPSSLTFSALGIILLSFQFTEKKPLLEDYMLFFGQIMLIFVNVVLILSTLDAIFERTYLKATDERRTDIEKFYRRHTNGADKYTEKEKFATEIIKYQDTENNE